MRFTLTALASILGTASVIASPTPAPSSAPLHASEDASAHIPDAYIIRFKDDVAYGQIQAHTSMVEGLHGIDPVYAFSSEQGRVVKSGGIKHVYAPTSAGFGYFGYAGEFTPETLEAIRSSPEVAYVERDQVVWTQEIPQGVDTEFNLASSGISTELGAPWGLARISHRPELKLSTFTKYEYVSDGGLGVDAYVIDTGINIDHVEFEGRASWGKTIPKNDIDKDGNGHGTHCAGTIASKKYGVAKEAHVIAVKVLGTNGSGSMSDVVAGVVWAAETASKKAADAKKELAATGKTKHKGSVANMSLGGGKSQSLDDAVDAAVKSGLHFAVAAGNDNKDACSYSPAASKLAVTVGASTLGDQRAYFSNHGKCVDVFAPGLNILSTWTGGNETTNTISGTSMASPHICGLLAYLLSIHGTETFNIMSEDVSEASVGVYASAYSLLPKFAQTVLSPFAPIPKHDEVTPAQLKKALIKLASAGLLTDLPTGTPNLLAFNNATRSSK